MPATQALRINQRFPKYRRYDNNIFASNNDVVVTLENMRILLFSYAFV